MLPILDKMDKVGFGAMEVWAVLPLILVLDTLRKIRGKD